MKKTPITLALALLVAACGGGGAEGAAPPAPGMPDGTTMHNFPLHGGQTVQAPAVSSEVVVMLATGASAAAVATAYGAIVIDQFGSRPIYRLRLAAGASLDTTVAQLRADSRVRFAEANAIGEAPEKKVMTTVWALGGDRGAFTAQWAPDALALPAALASSTGSGIRVAVLDTGVDAFHPVLAGQLARTAGGAVLGRDWVDDDFDPTEVGTITDAGWGHGTHVASVIALAAPGARIMPVRVLDAAGRGNAWVLAEALMWALDPDGNPATDDGARVVNISLGTTAPTRLLNTAIELATCSDDDEGEEDDDYSDPGFNADRERCNLRPGVVVMAAAGNSGSSTERMYPAAEGAEGQLAVTAGAQAGGLASFGNSGSWVQLAAPGERILGAVPNNQYASWSGSSMSTAWASGVAALVLARNPDWKPVDVSKRLAERSLRICGNNALRSLHADGAVNDFVPTNPACP